jgi:glycosyltransferase involved in cell wall biosynthesis
MTVSLEPRAPGGGPEGPLGTGWRAERERIQEAALPPGRVLVSCSAPFGNGGLGRHLREIVEALERRGTPGICVCASADCPAGAPPTPGRDPRGLVHGLGVRALAGALAPAVRASPAWRTWTASLAFDADAARRLGGAEHLIAFNGQALAQLRAARRARWQSVSLMSANSHLRHVARQHARAHRQYPLERSWSTRLVKRNLAEYARADRIWVATRYAWQSFVEAGISEERLALFPLTPAARYRPGDERGGATFDVVYVGSLTVAKGVPLLIDAVRGLDHPDLRLVLVGGWGTRGMRRFVQQACAEDPRIQVCPGDPLPHLRHAALCVHPAYEDGFAYAPAEALACGVPVVVSQDTGMKELIDSGRGGAIVPTGDLGALREAIEAAYRGEVFDG